MTKRIVQSAVIKVIQRQVAEYACDFCGKACGTRRNPKRTYYVMGSGEQQHYCLRACHPGSAEETFNALLGS